MNIIILLFLVLKKKSQPQETSTQMIFDQKMLDSQRSMLDEINGLRIELSKQQQLFLMEMEKLRTERQANDLIIKNEEPIKKEPQLFLNDRYKEIFTLHQQGLTKEEIAKKLDKGVGEVGLILQLADQEDA